MRRAQAIQRDGEEKSANVIERIYVPFSIRSWQHIIRAGDSHSAENGI